MTVFLCLAIVALFLLGRYVAKILDKTENSDKNASSPMTVQRDFANPQTGSAKCDMSYVYGTRPLLSGGQTGIKNIPSAVAIEVDQDYYRVELTLAEGTEITLFGNKQSVHRFMRTVGGTTHIITRQYTLTTERQPVIQ